nr:mediator of RNA polymerase II transcription subunit 1-like [Coffea arabica]
MERSEPALVPEWLRCTGNVGGGSPSSHHFSSSSLHSDVSSSSAWNRCSRSNSDKDSQRSPFLERNHSSNCRRSSGNNGSAKHPYSSFNRSHRDRNREKDKDRSTVGDFWDRDSSDPLESILTSVEKSSLRRSQSLVSRRTVELLPRKSEELKNGVNLNQYIANGSHLGGSNISGVHKVAFEKDFPSLGNEEKQGGSSIGRLSSPALSTAVQSLPVVNSGLLGGEKWTSALAEVPSVIGSNSIGNLSAQQSAIATPSASSTAMAGLNMAEALSQAPPRARLTPQVPDKTQRLEELAIKQSRQLIPMTPSMPKALVSSSSDKSKQPKAAARVNEMVVTPRNMQQQQQQPIYSPQLPNQSRAGQVRSDASNASHAGKFLVLKAAKENGANSNAKDASSPTNNSIRKVAVSQIPLSAITPIALTSPTNPKASTLDKKAAALSLNSRPTAEKKFSLSQAQSRSDFFNLMRKKTLRNTSSTISDSVSVISSPCAVKSEENSTEANSAPISPLVNENGSQMITDGDSHSSGDQAQSFVDAGERNLYLNGALYPDEEEAAFLRSLGWEENGEDVEITDEEIVAFYEEYQKFMPSLKVWRGIQPKCTMLSESHSSNSVAASSESGSVASEYEA